MFCNCEVNVQDTAFKFAHPLRVRIPQKFIKKREAIPKYHFSFGALQGIQAANRLACSATVAWRQYPPHTSRLKTVHGTVFLTSLTLSGFESLNKKTEATQNRIASVLARCKGYRRQAALRARRPSQSDIPASHFATKNSPQDCFLNAAHPLRVRIPE